MLLFAQLQIGSCARNLNINCPMNVRSTLGCYFCFSVHRVFDTSDWSFEEFVCNNPVTSCVWSSCSQYVVFSCSSTLRRDAGETSSLGNSSRGGSSVLYGISVDGSTREATVLVDLAPVQIMDQDESLVR